MQIKSSSAGQWLPLAVAGLALVPFLSLVISNDRVFATHEHCDYTTFYLPVREFARDELRNGRFPLWIPWLGGGLPLHATQQAALCNPILTPLILALCFSGQYRLARVFGASRAAASCAAVILTQSAFAVAHMMAGHVNQLFAFGAMPWLFLALVRHLRDANLGSGMFLAAIGSLLILSGHPQLHYYTVLIGFARWAGSLLFGIGSHHRLRCIGWTVAAVAVAMLIGLTQIIPTLELMRDNGRTSDRETANYAIAFALNRLDLLHFLMPNLRGNPFLGIPDYSSYYFFHERAGYLGLTAIVFAIFALSRETTARWDWGAATLIFLCILVALGPATSFFGILGKFVPGLNYFRCPGRILSVGSVFASLLTARGLDAAVRGEPRAGPRGLGVFVATLFLAGNGTAYVLMSGAERFSWAGYPNFARAYLVSDFVVSLLN